MTQITIYVPHFLTRLSFSMLLQDFKIPLISWLFQVRASANACQIAYPSPEVYFSGFLCRLSSVETLELTLFVVMPLTWHNALLRAISTFPTPSCLLYSIKYASVETDFLHSHGGNFSGLYWVYNVITFPVSCSNMLIDMYASIWD